MGLFASEVGDGWVEKNNQWYIDQWYQDPHNQMNHGNGMISHIGCAPRHTSWLERNGGFENGGSTIHNTFTSLRYEAYCAKNGSQYFNTVKECKAYCEA